MLTLQVQGTHVEIRCCGNAVTEALDQAGSYVCERCHTLYEQDEVTEAFRRAGQAVGGVSTQ